MAETLSLTFNVASTPTNVILPIVGSGIAVSVVWGDEITNTSLSHVYETNASFTAVITITAGSVTRFGSYNWPGVTILTAVATSNPATWGLPGVKSFDSAFTNANQLTSVPTGIPSSVTNLSNMFGNTSAFNQDISEWNVSNVTNMSSMFSYAIYFNQDITLWNVANVTNMNYMFAGANAFNQAIGGWNVSNVTNMNGMFNNNTAFNQNISAWNVSSVTDMGYMFNNNSAFNNGSTSDDGANPLTWTAGTGTANVTNMGSMFYRATAFNQDISTWNVSSVIYMNEMFYNYIPGQMIFNNGFVEGVSIGPKPLNWNSYT